MSEGQYYRINSETQRFESLGIGTECIITDSIEAYRVSVDNEPELLARRSVLYQATAFSNGMLLMVGGKDNSDCWITDLAGTPLYHFSEPMKITALAPKAIVYESLSDNSFHVARWEE